MKKIVLSFLFLAATIVVVAQTVSRSMVVMEVGTGTWCQYCPGAAMGADDLLSNGKFVAVIENHNGDGYANNYSNARNTLYGINAYPAAGFDGMQGYVGGNHSSSMYGTYLPIYNTRIANPSTVAMDIAVTNTGLNYTAVVTLTKVGTITATSLVLQFAVTQSHIQANWQGQTHLEHVNRLMVPSQNGTAVSFAGGNVQVVTLNFAMDATWPLADCEFITFLQDMDAGQGLQQGTTATYPMKKYETLNAVKRGTIDLSPDFTVVSNNVTTNTPVTFTNATTGGYIGVPESYEWIFPGGTPVSSFDKDPVVSYADQGTYDVTLIVNRGGQIDTLVRPGYITANFPVGIQKNQTIIATKVSPNPCQGILTLDVYSGKTVNVNVSVINSINIPVYQENGIAISGHMTKTIDLSNVAKGIYFVVVEQEGNKTVKKVIIN
ncbi:MAG: T9SS type A sorting domain-containing protein [Bacteroidota bacterium]